MGALFVLSVQTGAVQKDRAFLFLFCVHLFPYKNKVNFINYTCLYLQSEKIDTQDLWVFECCTEEMEKSRETVYIRCKIYYNYIIKREYIPVQYIRINLYQEDYQWVM